MRSGHQGQEPHLSASPSIYAEASAPWIRSGHLKVHILDADAYIREALRELLQTAGYDACAFSTPEDFMNAGLRDDPGCLILDVRLHRQSGLDFQRRLLDAGIAIPVIFLAATADVRVSVRGMKQGAVDFLLKPFRDDEILSAVDTALAVDFERRCRTHEQATLRTRHYALTQREQQVMSLVTAGLMNKQIAGQLGLSEVTIKSYRRHAMQKMGARSFADLVRMAERLRIGAVRFGTGPGA